jgi:DNA invertase Pin-like site-specific DNA recombinase
MYIAYFIENTGENTIDNTVLFNRIRELYIDENEVYADVEGSRVEFEKLLEVIEEGDRLVVRSVVDISDTATGLLNTLSDLQDRGVILESLLEPYISKNKQ